MQDMSAFVVFFTDHPFATLLIGVLFGVIGLFIYLFLKKDMRGISKNVEFQFKDLKNEIDSRFNKVDNRFNKVDSRFEKVEQGQVHIKELLNVKLDPIKKDQADIKLGLNNHVTTTDKKIDKLEVGQNDLKAGQSKLESKIDKILKKDEDEKDKI